MVDPLNAPVSHYLLDSNLSREIDAKTIDEIDIDGFTLMEIAGSSAAKILLSEYNTLSRGVYVCGKGNNAGDALVTARYLIQHEISAEIIFLGGTDNLSADAEKNLNLLKKFAPADKLSVYTGVTKLDDLSDFDFVVDGMLGTGLDSDVRKDYATAVEWINNVSAPVFSMDIPTGLHSDNGRIMGTAVQAAITFAFGGHKTGYYFNDGPELTGKVHYIELPFPNSFKERADNYLIDRSWISSAEQKSGRHKYEKGVLYIIAGSEGLTGAGIMAAISAWAEGLGAVILICPLGILPAFEQHLPSIIKKPVGNRNDYFFRKDHIESVLDTVEEKDGAVLIGPGLGRDKDTVQFVNTFAEKNTSDLILDADALWALSQQKWSKPEKTDWIITPHPGELSKLVEGDTSDDFNRLTAVKRLSREKKITVLSKGMPAIVGTSGGHCYITSYNTLPFARAGSGDVLAGKVAAYRALGNNSAKSCVLGLLNGKEKLDEHFRHNEKPPEPLDFI